MTHPRVPHPDALLVSSRSDRVADRISAAFGSMGMFWVLVGWQVGWIVLATVGAPLFRADPYPFAFLLFLSNLIQLWALPVLGTTANRADARRAAKADADHAALTHIAAVVDEIRERLDA